MAQHDTNQTFQPQVGSCQCTPVGLGTPFLLDERQVLPPSELDSPDWGNWYCCLVYMRSLLTLLYESSWNKFLFHDIFWCVLRLRTSEMLFHHPGLSPLGFDKVTNLHFLKSYNPLGWIWPLWQNNNEDSTNLAKFHWPILIQSICAIWILSLHDNANWAQNKFL